MGIFKAKDNVPQVYPAESRDFQLFLNVLDFVQNSLKFDIDTMTSTLSTDDISNNYLERLKSKVGFSSQNDYSNESLRLVLSSFPYFIRHKGSYEGIRRCVNVYLKQLGARDESKIDIYNDNKDIPEYSYTIRIGIPHDRADTTLLNDMLSYVVPTGYFVDIYFFKETSTEPTHSILNMKHHILVPPELENTSVRTDLEDKLEDEVFGTVELGMVYDPTNDKETPK